MDIIQYLSNEKSKKTDIINDYKLYIIQNKNGFIEKLTIKEELFFFQKLTEKNNYF